MKTCSIDGCQKPLLARGWCSAHYAKWKKYGDPLEVRQVQHHGLSLKERFWINVSRGNGCWHWTGYLDPNGYGRINVENTPKLAHRLSWEIEHGVILTPNQHVCHKCDNPKCVRPSHLFLGDQAKNMADKMAKGRHAFGVSRGEAHGCAKLTESDVRAIRGSGKAGKSLAEEFGISNSQVSDIRNRRVWKHLE